MKNYYDIIILLIRMNTSGFEPRMGNSSDFEPRMGNSFDFDSPIKSCVEPNSDVISRSVCWVADMKADMKAETKTEVKVEVLTSKPFVAVRRNISFTPLEITKLKKLATLLANSNANLTSCLVMNEQNITFTQIEITKLKKLSTLLDDTNPVDLWSLGCLLAEIQKPNENMSTAFTTWRQVNSTVRAQYEPTVDLHTLDEYNNLIKSEVQTCVHRIKEPIDQPYITIKCLTGGINYFVGSNIYDVTLGNLRKLITNATGIPDFKQRLIFKGKQFGDDTKTLKEFGLSKEDKIIHFVIRM